MREVLERSRSLLAFSGDTRQLQVGVGMRRVEFHEAFEPGLRLVRPATDEVVVAEVIQQRCRGRAISKGLPPRYLGSAESPCPAANLPQTPNPPTWLNGFCPVMSAIRELDRGSRDSSQAGAQR